MLVARQYVPSILGNDLRIRTKHRVSNLNFWCSFTFAIISPFQSFFFSSSLVTSLLPFYRVLTFSRQGGFADDYSFLIKGLLDLFEACQDQQWLQWAWQLQEKQNMLFWDEEKGGYFNCTADDPSILLRVKEG